ncbi:MAG: type I restriction endonuclease subunit M [Candidatus Methylumidiphilus alinenensis]|uniref:Type I restriction endonuclease subunit M n=1 Tax=Candidatus Methylumidiphilus alinenensis TaxID=2202197 RepID=A0A2W4SXW0_9GAMM|nr:MAG: type I restriction endonuclease subunit M [Candidatus Methylumidiphilus alinenensis]
MNTVCTQILVGTAKPVRFPSGDILATPGALETLERYRTPPFDLLKRHFTGDWGDLDDHDKNANEMAVSEGSRVFSAYVLPAPPDNASLDAAKIWVITEADRSATTLLLPEEY